MTTRYGTLVADGSTVAFTVNPGESIHAYGDFGGGTLTLQIKISGTWYTLKDKDGSTSLFAVTNDGSAGVEYRMENVRLTLSGATAPDIDWEVQ